MEASSENGVVAGVRRNPSIKRLLKLPMWGSGKCLKRLDKNDMMDKFANINGCVCMCVYTRVPFINSLIFFNCQNQKSTKYRNISQMAHTLLKHNRCNNIYINIFFFVLFLC